MSETENAWAEIQALRAQLERVTTERDAAALLLKEYRDEYTHTPRCMKDTSGPCKCGYDEAKKAQA